MTGGLSSQRPERRLRFGRHVLDLDRGSLFCDGDEVALRPKTFAVLRYLVENPGRLVSKEELFAAVWPDLSVTDDTLVQSVGELRRALGADGSRLIRTFPRRGYRFDTAVQADLPENGIEWQPPCATDEANNSMPRPLGSRSIWRPALALGALLAIGALWTWSAGPRLHEATGESAAPYAQESRPAIAVLPFRNLNDDPERDYIVDGLTQDIIGALGRFSALTVKSWNAVLPYKSKPVVPREIGRDLAVRYQVEGSVRLADERTLVNVQLVDGYGGVIWSSRFDPAIDELHSLQDVIAGQIAAKLAVRVTRAEQRRSIAKPTESLHAYDLVLRARPALHRPERGALAQARALLQNALQIDPNYAAAYSALAETYYIAVSMGWAEAPVTVLARAEELANKALALNDFDVRARVILGRVHLFHRRYERALAELDEAVTINPSDADGLAARGNILMWLGKTDAAIEALESAESIDPALSAFDRNALSMAYYLKGRYEAAIRQAEKTIDKTGVGHFSYAVIAAASAMLDRHEDAARAVSIIHRTDPTFDARSFGSKFLNATDLKRLRDGLRKSGLLKVAVVED